MPSLEAKGYKHKTETKLQKVGGDIRQKQGERKKQRIGRLMCGKCHSR